MCRLVDGEPEPPLRDAQGRVIAATQGTHTSQGNHAALTRSATQLPLLPPPIGGLQDGPVGFTVRFTLQDSPSGASARFFVAPTAEPPPTTRTSRCREDSGLLMRRDPRFCEPYIATQPASTWRLLQCLRQHTDKPHAVEWDTSETLFHAFSRSRRPNPGPATPTRGAAHPLLPRATAPRAMQGRLPRPCPPRTAKSRAHRGARASGISGASQGRAFRRVV